MISWRSKKQTTVSRLSTEVEYRALANATNVLIWLRWLLVDLGIDYSLATNLYCDNQSAIQIADNDVFLDSLMTLHYYLPSNEPNSLSDDLNSPVDASPVIIVACMSSR